MASPPFNPDQAKPADSDIVSQYPAVERTFRDEIESWLLIDHDTDGEHAQVTLPERADPGAVANTGILYTKDDGGDTELYYIDDAGNVVQITADGSVDVTGVFNAPATTSMLFYQTAAPSGWTKDTTTLNNHALRLVSSTAWSGGSKGATGFTSVFGAGKTAGNHTLTIAETPAHDHDPVTVRASGSGAGATLIQGATSAGTGTVSNQLTSIGGGNAHNHTLSLDINYVNVIRCTKN